LLPWAGLVAPGVILNKDGRAPAQRALSRPRPRRLHTSRADRGVGRVNNALKRLGSGWALFIEAQRRRRHTIPAATFPIRLSWLVDEERRALFEASGRHFESEHVLTFCYLPPPERAARANRML